LKVGRSEGEHLHVRDRLGELVDDLPADHAGAWQREVDPIDHLLVDELDRLAGFEWTALAVLERQISAARHANRIAARGQLGDLVAAVEAGARASPLASNPRRTP
jgi:hypothetical protein